MTFKDAVSDWNGLESIFKGIFALVCLCIAMILLRKNEQEFLFKQNLDKTDLENIAKDNGPDVTSSKREVKMVGDNYYNAKYPEDKESGVYKSTDDSSWNIKLDSAEEPSVLKKVPQKNLTKDLIIDNVQSVKPRTVLVAQSLSNETEKTSIQKEIYRQKKRIPWYQKVIQELKTRIKGSKLTSYFLLKTNFPMKSIKMSN
jgi:hypothetical protein